MDRRRFLKYAGATAAVVGASALGVDYVLSPQLRPLNPSATISNQRTSKFNFPPNAYFMYKPKYLNPTDQETIQFTNLSSDAENEPLSYRWLVDGEPVSTEKDYATKLSVGQHEIDLEVTDPLAKSTAAQMVTVEPDQIYPTKPLKIKYKGMIYAAARFAPEFTATPSDPTPSIEEIDEQLTTIRSELGCNAVYLRAGGGYEDNLVEACEVALRIGFDRIYAEMKYMHATAEETAQKLAEFAPRIKALRDTSDSIVFSVGSEFVFSIKGILPGEQWLDQLNYAVQNYDDYIKRMKEHIPKVFETIVPVVKRNYGYPVAYAAEVNEANFVPWQDPALESVCIDLYFGDAYGVNEQWILNYMNKFRKFGKPINWSEFGCLTYTGGGYYGFMTPAWATSPYDEDEQAKYIQRYCNTFSRADIEGAYYYIYNEEWDKGFGLYNRMKRKKGFYMYKSYQRSS